MNVGNLYQSSQPAASTSVPARDSFRKSALATGSGRPAFHEF